MISEVANGGMQAKEIPDAPALGARCTIGATRGQVFDKILKDTASCVVWAREPFLFGRQCLAGANMGASFSENVVHTLHYLTYLHVDLLLLHLSPPPLFLLQLKTDH